MAKKETLTAKKERPAATEAVRPTNIRADIMPHDGYVLSVDGKLKTRFETSEEAMTAGLKLKESFPVIQVAVFDATAQNYTPVVLQED